MNTFIIAVATYLAGLAVALGLHRRELARSPEKAHRYRHLPLAYRAMCWTIVVPWFTAIPAALFQEGHGVLAGIAIALVAPVALVATEIAAVSWYRRHGFL